MKIRNPPVEEDSWPPVCRLLALEGCQDDRARLCAGRDLSRASSVGLILSDKERTHQLGTRTKQPKPFAEPYRSLPSIFVVG